MYVFIYILLVLNFYEIRVLTTNKFLTAFGLGSWNFNRTKIFLAYGFNRRAMFRFAFQGCSFAGALCASVFFPDVSRVMTFFIANLTFVFFHTSSIQFYLLFHENFNIFLFFKTEFLIQSANKN